MAKIKFDLNRGGVRELLFSSELQSECGKYADAIRSAAGEGYESDTTTTPSRAGYEVKAVTREAYYKNLQDNTLATALWSAKR